MQQWILVAVLAIMVYTISLDLRLADFRYVARHPLAVGIGLPERQATAQVQAVPREGVSFNDTVTARVTIETVDTDTRTVAFDLQNGRTLLLPVADGVRNLDALAAGSIQHLPIDRTGRSE